MIRKLWLDEHGVPAITTTRNGENNAVHWGWTPAAVHPLPTRDEIKKVLQREFGSFLAHSPHNPERFWGQAIDAVLALMKGQDA